MKCPKCQIDLSISDRQGIEIDFCPQCRGVWLDRGELDKITERAARFNDRDDDDDRWQSERRENGRDADVYRRDPARRPRSFWSDLFD